MNLKYTRLDRVYDRASLILLSWILVAMYRCLQNMISIQVCEQPQVNVELVAMMSHLLLFHLTYSMTLYCPFVYVIVSLYISASLESMWF